MNIMKCKCGSDKDICIDCIMEENEEMKEILRNIYDAHLQSTVDWDAMKKIPKYIYENG